MVGIVNRTRLVAVALTVPLAVASALVMGMASAAADVGFNSVNVGCGDGSPFHANVDPVALTKLAGALQAANQDLSDGVTCTVSSQGSGNETEARAFVFGAGAYGGQFGCIFDFKLKAHLDEQGAHGFQHNSSPNANPADCGGPGVLNASVTCLVVAGKRAEIRGVIESASGPQFDFIPQPHQGKVWVSDVTENPPGVPDTIEQGWEPAGTQDACAIGSLVYPEFPIDHGDIDVESSNE